MQQRTWILLCANKLNLARPDDHCARYSQAKVFEKIKNTAVEITSTKLVGNGAYGTLSIDKFDRSAGGSSLFLKNLLVTSMVEYVQERLN